MNAFTTAPPATGAGPVTTTSRFDDRLEFRYVLCLAVGYLLPLLVSSYSEPKRFRPITEATASTDALTSLASTAGNALVLVASLVVLWRMRRRWRDLLGPSSLLVVGWVVAVAGMLAHHSTMTRDVALFPLVVAAITVLRPGADALRAMGWVTLTLASVSLLMGLLTPDAGRYARPEALADEKPLTSLGILAGPYPSGNNLGVALAIGLPTLLWLHRRWVAALGLVLTLAALLWTASRTALIAATLAVAVGVVMRLVERWRDVIAAVVLSGLATIALLLPLVTRSPSAFTNRGTYWVAGRETWLTSPWLGRGPAYYWDVARESGALGGFAYHAHNQAMQLLVTGGVLLLAIVAAVVVWAIVRAVRAADVEIAPTMMLIAVLVTATFEVPLGFVDRQMYHPFALVALLVVLCANPAAVTVGTHGPTSDAPRRTGLGATA